MAKEIETYRYTECGLDDVIIEGLPVCVDDDEEETIAIPNINKLHRAIAESIVESPAAMTGKHLRFLRTEMGLTMAELAQIVHKDHQTIGRWERGETALDPNAEAVIRLIAIERLEVGGLATAETVSARCLPKAGTGPIRIDGRDPNDYRPMAAWSSIDLDVAQRLKEDPEFRQEFFLAEASALIARQLIALRKRRGLNQQQVAELLETKQPAISRIESADYQNWSFNNLRRYAGKLDARIRVLIEPSEDVLPEYEETGDDPSATTFGHDALKEALGVLRNDIQASAKPHGGGTLSVRDLR